MCLTITRKNLESPQTSLRSIKNGLANVSKSKSGDKDLPNPSRTKVLITTLAMAGSISTPCIRQRSKTRNKRSPIRTAPRVNPALRWLWNSETIPSIPSENSFKLVGLWLHRSYFARSTMRRPARFPSLKTTARNKSKRFLLSFGLSETTIPASKNTIDLLVL